MDERKALRAKASPLAPGALTEGGFLGGDERPVEEMIGEDRAVLEASGTDSARVGAAMVALSDAAIGSLGREVAVGPILVSAEEARGRMVCPFGEGGLLPKAIVTARRPGDSRVFSWSYLSAHLALAHGFFGGRGSPYRLEPGELADFLFQQPPDDV